MKQQPHCSHVINTQWLQHLFYDPYTQRKPAARVLQLDQDCQSLLRYLSKTSLDFHESRLNLKTDIIAECTEVYAGDPSQVTVCLLAAYLYFILGREFIRQHISSSGAPINCVGGVSKKKKFLTTFAVFLEWKGRWRLPAPPYQQFIPTAHLDDEGRLGLVWEHVAKDVAILKEYHAKSAWFRTPQPRTTYQRYEDKVRSCLARLLQNEQNARASAFQQTDIDRHLRGEQFVLYNDQVRKRLNHTPYGAELPLTTWFIPPPLKQPAASSPVSLDPWVHRNQHLVIIGEMGAGKTALLHHLALRQPIEMAPIWLSQAVAPALRSLKTEQDVYAQALTHLWPQQDPREREAWMRLLRGMPERFIILDALTMPSQRVLTLLQGMGRVLMALPVQGFDANRLPDPSTWDILEIDAWSPERLTCAMEKHQPARRIDLTEVATHLERDIPPYPGWVLPLSRTSTVGEAERYHALDRMMQEKLTGQGSSLAGEIRRLAWELQRNPDQTCAQSTGQPATQPPYLGDKLCQKAIPWAEKRGLLQLLSNHIPAFAHSDLRAYLAAEYVALQYWRQQQMARDSLVRFTPGFLSGTENAGDILAMIVLADLRHNAGRHLPHFVEGLQQQYITPPRYGASLDLFLEVAQPVGLLKRLIDHADWIRRYPTWSTSISQSVQQMHQLLEAALWRWTSSLFTQNAILPRLKTFGLAVAALEPLHPGLADFIAGQVLDHPHVLQDPHIRHLLSPQIKRALDKVFLSGVDARRWNSREQEIRFNLLLQHQALSPDTMQYVMDTRSARYITALAQRGGAPAADALATLWQSPRIPDDAAFFDIVLNAWQGSAIRLFRLLETLQFYFRSLHRSIWKSMCRAFLRRYRNSDELLCILRQLPELAAPCAAFILRFLPEAEMGNTVIALALAEVLKQQASDQEATEAKSEAEFDIDSAPSDALSLARVVRRALYQESIDDAILSQLSAEDLLFLFQFDLLPPDEPWHIARQVIEMQLEFLPDRERAHYRSRVSHWAEYVLTQIPRNPSLLATAILLAPCESPVLDMWWSDHSSPLVSEALHIRWEKCR